MRIAVVGRGVIGLSCGLLLAESHDVTIISRPANRFEVPTSRVAAAFWFPYLTSTDAASGFTEEWLASRTLDHFRGMAERPESGVRWLAATEYACDIDPASHANPWWHTQPGVHYRRLSPSELPELNAFGRCTFGCEFVIPVIRMPNYLAYLESAFEKLGGHYRCVDVDSLDALNEWDVIVNAAGLGARELANDSQLMAVRGQVLIVRNFSYLHNRLYFLDQGADFAERPIYIVPRGEDLVLGGTAEILAVDRGALTSESDHRPDPVISQQILERCCAIRPELRGIREFETRVGLRPVRYPVRIQFDAGTYARPVVHCYGHGGAGVTLSWGSAHAVQNLIASHC